MKISRNFSAALDCIRWLAALEVVGFHLRRLMFSYAPGLWLPWKLFFLLTSFGHEAVIVFFVLSGFLVGGSVMDDLRLDRFSWRIYLAKRIARLYPVFFLGLLLGLGFDTVGVHYFNHYPIGEQHTGVYTTPSAQTDLATTVVASNLGPPVLIANLLMLQTIVQPSLGSNGPLWSLANEFWYYMLFPLAMAVMVFRKSSALRAPFIYVVLFAAIAYMVGGQIMAYFLIWLLGVVPAVLTGPAPANAPARILAVISPLAVALALAFCKYQDLFNEGGFCADLMLGAAIALLMYAFKESRSLWVGPPGVHRFLADFSYSLYIIHFPMLLLAMAILSDHTRFHFLAQPSGPALAVFAGLAVMALFLAYCFSLVTERQTPAVRDVLLRATAPRPHREKEPAPSAV